MPVKLAELAALILIENGLQMFGTGPKRATLQLSIAKVFGLVNYSHFGQARRSKLAQLMD